MACHILSEMKANDAAAGIEQRLPVTQRLRQFEHAERHCRFRLAGFVGNRGVLHWIGSELNEKPVAGVTFVELAGGMQKARAVSNRRGKTQTGLNFGAQLLQCRLGCRRWLDISL